MKAAIYFCNCGGTITERIDPERVIRELGEAPAVAYVRNVDYLCSEEGKAFLEKDLLENRPDRVVVAACSPREYESTFMRCLDQAGMNPYYLQMVNIREQVAWVTPDPGQATQKALTMIRGAVARVRLHEPLEKKELEVCPDAVVIGAGPAGLKAALTMAEAGRNVTLVEKSPMLGGMPIRFEDLFPNLECGPCLIEPVLAEALHGAHAANIEILTLAEVVDVAGYYGNFTVRVRQAPRYVDLDRCIGCGLCVPPCPVTTPNEYNYGLSQRQAMSFPFSGVLPSAPFLDNRICLRSKGEDCRLCQAACPVEGAVRFDDQEKIIEKKAGAIVVATGSGLYECGALPALGHGRIPGVYTSLEFERMLAANGPTSGKILKSDGQAPQSLAIVHCVGSLDARHQPYCSGICCEYAFKFNHLVESKLPGTPILHLYKELVMPGKEEHALYRHARNNPHATFVRYADIADVEVGADDGRTFVRYRDAGGKTASAPADMVVLCPAVVAGEGAGQLGVLLDTPRDEFGFFEELHGRLAATESKIKGIYLAGACQSPMDIQKAASQGMASAGSVLSGLVPGRKLTIEPITAWIEDDRCSGCKFCRYVCPYKAISFSADSRPASLNALLCQGCGTCVAACPAGAIQGNHFTNAQIFAEIEAVLQ
jgi:heterodisulfide reductase subunit A